MNPFRRGKKHSESVDAVAQIEAHQAEIIGRGRPDLQDGARPLAPGAKAFMALLTTVGITALGLLTWRAMATDDEPERSSVQAEIRNILPDLKLAPAAPPPAPTPAPSAPAVPAAPPTGSATAEVPAIRSAFSLPKAETAPPTVDPVIQRRLSSSLRRDDQGSRDSGRRAATPPSTTDAGPLAESLQPLRLSSARAARLGDRDLLLTQGSMIDCVQETRLVSAQAGMITCHATQEVRSTSGRVALVDPGTRFVGYQRGVLAHGQPRIGIVWTRMETPDGVVVHLDSPGTGPLGEAGLDGHIDTHFAERFGAAVMISLISDLGAWASHRSSSGEGNTLRLDNTSSAAESSVSTVLDHTINIPPTLYRNQGGRIGIYVARDLDFSSVYELRPARR